MFSFIRERAEGREEWGEERVTESESEKDTEREKQRHMDWDPDWDRDGTCSPGIQLRALGQGMNPLVRVWADALSGEPLRLGLKRTF